MDRFLIRAFAVAAIILGASTFLAAQPSPQQLGMVVGSSPILSQTALNATESERTTSVVYVAGNEILATWSELTRTTMTDFQMTCFGARSSSPSQWAPLQSIDSAGVSTDAQPTIDVSAVTSKEVPWRWDVRGIVYVRCVASATGAAATDLVVVHHTLQ